jgi:HK97 family phage portal protein
MNWFNRMIRRGEQRSGTVYWPGAGFLASGSGQPVNARLAENLATVSACIGAVSSAIASLPAYCYRGAPRGRAEVAEHPVARLIRRPNQWQTWPDWIEWTVAQALAFGNAISSIEYDGAGRVIALRPIPWQNVQAVLLPNGELAFDVIAYTAPWGGNGQPRRLLASEVFHLRDRSDDGLLGRSRLSRAPEVIGNALALQEWAGSIWANSATPSGAIKLPQGLGKEMIDRIRSRLQQTQTGASNARKVLLLEGGVEWQSISVSPEDAEVLASRRFSVEELCRLYQVPPPIIQDLSHGTFTNSREAGRWFAQFSLGPWVRKIEAEFSRSVFTDPAMSLELDMSALMRGDAESRWASHKIAVEAGILTPDEVREIEGFNPRGGREAPVVE